MRTIVVGDVHGCYNELIDLMNTLIKEKEYNKETDKLIFLGDYIDRGDNSKEVIHYIRELQKNNKNVIALKGNHEDMWVKWYEQKDYSWLYNGYEETIKSYQTNGKLDEQIWDDIKWAKQLPMFYEDDNFIYVHAGITPNKPLKEQSSEELLWVRDDFIFNTAKFEKQIIFGHTPSLAMTEEAKPYKTYANNLCIDTGCVYGGNLTAVIIENEKIQKFYQTKQDNKQNIIMN